MPNWIRVAELADLPPGQALEVVAGDRIVALFNVDGKVFALDGVCPHQGGPLGKGELCGGIVTCPWHGAKFDVRTGNVLGPPAPAGVASYKVVVEDGEIKIEV